MPDQPVQVPLTGREQAVLRLVAAGKTNQEIRQELNLDKKLVETYLEAILAKLGVASQEAAAKRANQLGLIREIPTAE